MIRSRSRSAGAHRATASRRCRRVVLATTAILALTACNSGERGTATSSPPVSPTFEVTSSTTNPGDLPIGLPPDQNSPISEVELVSALRTAIDGFRWPAAHELTAEALWTSKLQPAAATTMLGQVDAVQLVEAWNMCAWALEVSEAVATQDRPRIAAASEVLVHLDSQFRYTSSGGMLTQMADEANDGDADLATTFIAANSCQDWPKA